MERLPGDPGRRPRADRRRALPSVHRLYRLNAGRFHPVDLLVLYVVGYVPLVLLGAHRWHHSRVLAEANANYGSNLTIWDVAFGTFVLPSDRLPPADIGIAAMPAFPATYLAQLAVPFRWTAAQRDAARQSL